MKLRGNDITVFRKVDGWWKTMALATSCDLEVYARLMEKAEGDFKAFVVQGFDWRGNMSNLMAVDSAIDWKELIEDDSSILINVSRIETDEAKERYPDENSPAGGDGIMGEAVISKCQINAGKDGKASASISFVGTSELEGFEGYTLFVPTDYECVEMDGRILLVRR